MGHEFWSLAKKDTYRIIMLNQNINVSFLASRSFPFMLFSSLLDFPVTSHSAFMEFRNRAERTAWARPPAAPGLTRPVPPANLKVNLSSVELSSRPRSYVPNSALLFSIWEGRESKPKQLIFSHTSHF